MTAAARFDARLVAVSAAGIAAFLNVYAPQPLLPTLVNELGVDAAAAGFVVSAGTLSMAVASPLAGVVVARASRRSVLWVCFAAQLVTLIGCATSTGLHTLVAWRFLQGLFIPPLLTLTMAFVGQSWERRDVGHIMSIYVAANVIGGFSGRLITGIATAHVGWRTAFLVLAAADLACAWLVLAAMPEGHGPAASLDLAVLARHLRDGRLRVAYATGFTVLFALVALFTYVNHHLAAPPFRLGPGALGWVFSVYLVGCVVTPLGGRLIAPWGHRRVIVGATVVAMLGGGLTLVPSLSAILAGLTVCSSCVFIMQSAATGYVSDVAGIERASALGLYLCCYYLGGSLGAVAPGIAWSGAGWPGTIALLLAVQAVTILLALRLDDRPLHEPMEADAVG